MYYPNWKSAHTHAKSMPETFIKNSSFLVAALWPIQFDSEAIRCFDLLVDLCCLSDFFFHQNPLHNWRRWRNLPANESHWMFYQSLFKEMNWSNLSTVWVYWMGGYQWAHLWNNPYSHFVLMHASQSPWCIHGYPGPPEYKYIPDSRLPATQIHTQAQTALSVPQHSASLKWLKHSVRQVVSL